MVDLLTMITDRCVEAFDSAMPVLAAPIGGGLRVVASSSVTTRDLGPYEVQASEGPCLDCYRSGEPVRNERLDSTRERWPGFAPVAFLSGARAFADVATTASQPPPEPPAAA